MTKKMYIDSSVFMGLHAKDEEKRLAAKKFFVTHFGRTLYMNLEEVGMCDDIVWGYTREEQDSYYPFMDNLHTIMRIARVPYTAEIIGCYEVKEGFSTRESLLLATVTGTNSSLVTFNENLLQTKQAHIISPESATDELSFGADLEKMYQHSLALRV